MNPFEMKSSKRYQVCRPNKKFWDRWRENKEELKDEGVRVTKIDGRYYVLVPANFSMEGEDW